MVNEPRAALDSLRIDSWDDLLTEAVHERITELANLRRRVEVQCRNLPMA